MFDITVKMADGGLWRIRRRPEGSSMPWRIKLHSTFGWAGFTHGAISMSLGAGRIYTGPQDSWGTSTHSRVTGIFYGEREIYRAGLLEDGNLILVDIDRQPVVEEPYWPSLGTHDTANCGLCNITNVT